MKHLLLLFFSVLSFTSIFAGGDEPSPDPPRIFSNGIGLWPGQVGFHIVPTGLIGVSRGARFGAQVRVGRLIIGGDVLLGGNKLAKVVFTNPDLLNYEATGFYPEIKLVFGEDEKGGSGYVSAVVPIRTGTSSYGSGSYVEFEENTRYDFDAARREYRKTSVGIKIGAIKSLTGPIYYEYYFGFGFGTRNTFYSDFDNLSLAAEQPENNERIDSDLQTARRCFQMDILAGIRVGFRL